MVVIGWELTGIGVPLWHLDTKMMMLATYYIMMYLWTLGICSNIQR